MRHGTCACAGADLCRQQVDRYVIYETWTSVGMAGADVTFSRVKRQAFDTAYVPSTVEGIVVATIVKEVEAGIVLKFTPRPHVQSGSEEELLSCEAKGWYLARVDLVLCA